MAAGERKRGIGWGRAIRSGAVRPAITAACVGRLLAGLLMAALLLWSLAWGAAGVLNDRAERLVPAGADPSPARLAAARSDIRWARRLDPLSPDLRATDAALLERAAADPALPAVAADARLAHAERLHLEALALRPTGPYSAAALVRLRLKRGRPGPEPDRALALAVELGRWEPGLQRGLLATAFAAWPLLPATDRSRLAPLIEAGLRLQPEAVMDLAAGRGRWSVIAPFVAGDARLEALARRHRPAAEP